MQDRASLPLAERRRFLTGRPSLDFAHTGGEGSLARWEILHRGDDLARWLSLILGVEVVAEDAEVAAARQVRNAIGRLAYARAAAEAWAPADVQTVNTTARGIPPTPQLRPDGTFVNPVTSVEAALSALARDAIDLFSGPLGDRIRVCAAENCGLLLVDASRPGDRRWCSMQVCGNRAKVRAHREARKG